MYPIYLNHRCFSHHYLMIFFHQWLLHHVLLSVGSSLLLIISLRNFINKTSFLLSVPANNIKISCGLASYIFLACSAKIMASINSLTHNDLNLLKSVSFMNISAKSFYLDFKRKSNSLTKSGTEQCVRPLSTLLSPQVRHPLQRHTNTFFS